MFNENRVSHEPPSPPTFPPRDLMTWCSRSSVNFDHTESSQGQKVFLEAVDCFVTNLSKTSVRLKLAASIGCKLNIPEDRVRHTTKSEGFCFFLISVILFWLLLRSKKA